MDESEVKSPEKSAGTKKAVGAKKSKKGKKKAKAKKGSKRKAAKNLVIVESPAKANTIGRYLGPSFDVKASVGHIRDLPKSRLGVDVDNNFKQEIINIKGKGPIIKELKSAAKKAEIIYLAPDPDREGEAIAHHIREIVDDTSKVYRVKFNEITKKAVKAAIENPLQIDANKVQAQQARRVLDRLVGYKLSPLLWEKVRRGLSAGRVQSVVMRMVTDREKEVKAFVPKEYWSIKCIIKLEGKSGFDAKLFKIGNEKFELNNEAEAKEAVDNIKKEQPIVDSLTVKDKKRNAAPPFITSSMQQAASQRFRFTANRTMRAAQGLYEGKEMGSRDAEGLITYMRTDSTRIADEAISEVRGYIEKELGADYLPEKPNSFKVKKSAQEGHEAIRPTSVARTPESVKQFLSTEEFKLYDLIWKRFVASQTAPAVITTTTADIAAGRYTLRGTGSYTKFHGFLKVYADNGEKEPENIIPPMEKDEKVVIEEIAPNQHFTQPPPRYTEASLIRDLEEKGIGRPSTYASIMNTIQNRDYAEIIERKIHPTELGSEITEMLLEHFPKIMEVEFTARMEEELDQVEEGKKDWVEVLREFYEPFAIELENAHKNMVSKKIEEETDELCEKCGANMVIKYGRFGKFMACKAYPECKSTKPYSEDGKEQTESEKIDEKCPTCGKDMVLKVGRFGKFIACSDYPNCKTTKAITLGIKCPKDCGGEIVQRRSKKGRFFYGCASYPKCDFVSWEKPHNKACPKCANPFLVFANNKKSDVATLKCPVKECDHTEEMVEETSPETADKS